MEASTTFNCSRKMAVNLRNTFAFWRILVIKAWQTFTKTVRRLSRNPNITLWRKESSKEIGHWLADGFWLNIYFASWKCFASWVKGIGIAEKDLICASIWSPQFTTLNSTKSDFCKRSIVIIPAMSKSPRPLDPESKPDDRVDNALRPERMKDLIGQDQVKENLGWVIHVWFWSASLLNWKLGGGLLL